jgi:hypothetical protein
LQWEKRIVRPFCVIIFGLFVLTSVDARAHLDSAVPVLRFTEGGLTRAEFSQTIRVFEAVFAPYAARDNRTFEILSDWNEAWPQAFARRWETDHLIVYGGIARIPGSTIDSFALTLCHEVGHLYGGEPFGDSANRMAVEGQADYWAASECWEKIVNELPLREGSVQDRGVAAAIVLSAFFAANRNLPAPRVETPDTSVADLQGGAVLPELHEGFLHDILGFGLVLQNAPGHAEQNRHMAIDQHAEGSGVARTEPRHQRALVTCSCHATANSNCRSILWFVA